MSPEFKRLLRTDFLSFVHRAIRDLEPGKNLGQDRYLEVLAHEIAELATGRTLRQIVNLPPKHFKTGVASVCGAAWILGREPSTEIMIVTHNEMLAENIAYKIRKILQAPWFREVFGVSLARDRAQLRHFLTTGGGGVYAAPLGGGLTGFGADVIIVDDPHRIDDAADVEALEAANHLFDTVVESRLNDPGSGRILIVAHRVHLNDLSGHLLAGGGWRHLSLPMIATADTTIEYGSKIWHRRKGEPLRPKTDENRVARLRADPGPPNFDTLWQQDPCGGVQPIYADCFGSFPDPYVPTVLPAVLSIDPGQRGGPENSFSVVQAWVEFEAEFYLVDQFRQQCLYNDFEAAVKKFLNKYRPSAVILEMTGHAFSLVSTLDLESWNLVRVTPRQPKAQRLAKHNDKFSDGKIVLPERARWRAEFIDEFVNFSPDGFTDQVDAATQYFDFMDSRPVLCPPTPRGLVSAGGFSNHQPFSARLPFPLPRGSNIAIAVGLSTYQEPPLPPELKWCRRRR